VSQQMLNHTLDVASCPLSIVCMILVMKDLFSPLNEINCCLGRGTRYQTIIDIKVIVNKIFYVSITMFDCLTKVICCSKIIHYQRSLGLLWDSELDEFTFSVSTDVKPYTRRGVLSTINSLYDPCHEGFV
jgi:hypothetical protein